MVSTTMYFTPVAPIMKSYDLINWKIISYCTGILEDLPAFRLETETADRIGDYNRGQWASSIRYFDDRFWVLFMCLTTNKSYVFSTSDPENEPWQRTELNRAFYDPSILRDETTGKTYFFYGRGAITATEMENDLSAVKPDGLHQIIITSPDAAGGNDIEGVHAYYVNDFYYIFAITWASPDVHKRTVLCYRAGNIEGPYEGRIVLQKGLGDRDGGVAQGGILQTQDGDWYGLFFQDRDAVGRIPVLVPMRWSDDHWPVFGDADGAIPEEFEIKQFKNHQQNLYVSDEFDAPTLPLAWQWNHNPDNDLWSLTERPGFLRLTTGGPARTIFHARNTLTQRTFEPACEGIIALEPTNMKDGDIAGFAALAATAGFVGIEREGDQQYIVMYTADNENSSARGQNAVQTRVAQVAFNGSRVYFKISFKFRGAAGNAAETANFAYSLDGENWQEIGTTLNLRYTLSHFTGYRFGLFNYATREAGGYVDFDYFHVRICGTTQRRDY